MATDPAVERAILFSAPMVRAVLSGQKTQTRRIAKPPARAVFLPGDDWMLDEDEPGTAYFDDESGRLRIKCPYGQPGDRLWVRETWADAMSEDGPVVCYRANLDRRYLHFDAWPIEYERYPGGGFSDWASDLEGGIEGRWRPSIHMPRWASRLILDVTEVRIERVQDLTEADAIAEACWLECDSHPRERARAAFRERFQATNGYGSWEANPWVWVVAFRVVTP